MNSLGIYTSHAATPWVNTVRTALERQALSTQLVTSATLNDVAWSSPSYSGTVCLTDVRDPHLSQINQLSAQQRRPFVIVTNHGNGVLIGPAISQRGPCWQCVERYQRLFPRALPSASAKASSVDMQRLSAEIATLLHTPQASRLSGGIVIDLLPSGTERTYRILFDPTCVHCSGYARHAREVLTNEFLTQKV